MIVVDPNYRKEYEDLLELEFFQDRIQEVNEVGMLLQRLAADLLVKIYIEAVDDGQVIQVSEHFAAFLDVE